MNAKAIFGICCVLLMGITPFVGAHLTNPTGSATSAQFTGDPYRWGGSSYYTDEGVSGSYIGPAGVGVSGKDTLPVHVDPLLSLCPAGFCATAAAECDFEVLGPGDGTTDVLIDEQNVDGGSGNGGQFPDGTFDDGGQGAACHFDHYVESSYNTEGCRSQTTSHAKDAVSGGAVMILAGCDDATQITDNGPVFCLENAERQVSPNDAVGCVGVTVSTGLAVAGCAPPALDSPVSAVQGCAAMLVPPVAMASTCIPNVTCGAGVLVTCGADGITDWVNVGSGGGVHGKGIAYPASLAVCSGWGTMVTYSLSSVNVDGKSVSPATAGWIDWTETYRGSPYPYPSEGTGVNLCVNPMDLVFNTVAPGSCPPS